MSCAINKRIRVKLSTLVPELWLRQFPGKKPVWGACEFIFDPDESNYDWFVVYNDLPQADMQERLGCSQKHTLLVTTEPLSIKSYGLGFTRQFGCVLTSQPKWALPHPNRIFSQPALHWFYGWGKKRLLSYDEIVSMGAGQKTKTVATVCSSKKQRHTLHNKRYQFTQALKERLPLLDVYGHGVKPMADKAESLDPYRYHVAIENYQGEHHWTEKLADAFLGMSLPFYFGCTNVTDYFPEESLVQIDLFRPEEAFVVIERTIRDNEYERRQPYIYEARKLVLEKYNIFAVLAAEIEARHQGGSASELGGEIFSRRLLRKQKPLVAVRDLVEKGRVRLGSLLGK